MITLLEYRIKGSKTFKVLLLLLAIFLNPIIGGKNIEMEIRISKYIADNTDSKIFEKGFAQAEETHEMLVKELKDLQELGIDTRTFEKAKNAAIKPYEGAEQKKMYELAMIRYLLDQPEMMAVTNFSKTEMRCLIMRRFVSSLPFKNPEFANTNILTQITDQYNPISYRKLALKILLDKGLFSEQNMAKIKVELRNLIQTKQAFYKAMQDLKMENVPIYIGDTDKIREVALEKLEVFQNEKNNILKEFGVSKAKVELAMEKALEIAQTILEENEDLENQVTKYNDTLMFLGIVENMDDPQSLLEEEFITNQIELIGDLGRKTEKYAGHVQKYNQYNNLKNYMESVKDEMEQAYQVTEKLVQDEKKNIDNYKNYIIQKCEQLKNNLYENLKSDNLYSQFLANIETYQDELKDLTFVYDLLTEVNRKIERLYFLIEKEDVLEGTDIVVGPNVMISIEREINQITSLADNFNNFSDRTTKIKQMNQLHGEIVKTRDFDFQREETLRKAKTLLEQINAIEQKFDKILAQAFEKAMLITNKTGQSTARMMCFDEVDLGHLIMNMVKTNMILNLDVFMAGLTSNWDYVTTKRFVLRNYYMLTSADYQGSSLVNFSEKKFMGASEENQLKSKLLEDYSLRMNFFTGLYRQKVEEIDFSQGRSFWSKTGLFFSAIVKMIWNFLTRSAVHFTIDKIVEFILDKIKSIIPFIGTIKILYRYLKSLLFVLIEELWEYLKEKFYQQIIDLRVHWGQMLRKLNVFLGNREIMSTNTNEFFKKNDAWMSWQTTCWQYDFCYEDPIPQSHLEPMDNNVVFYLNDLKEVEEKYVKHLQIKEVESKKYEAINYIRMINEFRGDNYLLSYDRLEKDPNLLVTACLYYKGKLNLRGLKQRQKIRRLLLR